MSLAFLKSALRPWSRRVLVAVAVLAVAIVPWAVTPSAEANGLSFMWVDTGNVLDCGSVMRCAEWCLVGPNGPEPTGQICCVDPSDIGTNDANACGGLRGPLP